MTLVCVWGNLKMWKLKGVIVSNICKHLSSSEFLWIQPHFRCQTYSVTHLLCVCVCVHNVGYGYCPKTACDRGDQTGGQEMALTMSTLMILCGCCAIKENELAISSELQWVVDQNSELQPEYRRWKATLFGTSKATIFFWRERWFHLKAMQPPGTLWHQSNSTLSLFTADLSKLDQCDNLLCVMCGQ